jgi:hypothetical protein
MKAVRLFPAAILAAVATAAFSQSLSPHPAAHSAIQGSAFQTPWIDESGVIASTGVAQALFPADVNRTGCFVQNQGTHNMTVDIKAVNAITHLQLVPSAYYECPWIFVPPGAITITGTVGDAYAAAEW